jgi:threonine aldolase
MPSRLVDVLKNENCIFYSWGEDEGMIFARLVTSFNTTKEEVDDFLVAVDKAVSQQ